MAALQRALALAEMDERAAAVADDLDLDVARLRQQLLDVHAIVAESARRLGAAARVRGGQLVGAAHDAHAAAAAAGHRLDHDRRRRPSAARNVRASSSVTAPPLPARTGTSAAFGERAGARLVAEQRQRLGLRADEGQSRRGAAAGEVRLLGEEAVAGVERVTAGCARRRRRAGPTSR